VTDVPAGWYPDPAMPYPGQPPTQRYWDGRSWTMHIAPVYWPYAAQVARRPTTPDGVPLANWLPRAGAFLIDSLAISVVNLVVTLPLQISMQRKMQDLVVRLDTTNPNNPPDFGAFFRDYFDILWPLVMWSGLATFVCWAIYEALMLRFKGSTLGMMVLKLQVRPRERPGQLPWSAIGLRILVQFGYLLTAVVPLLYLALFWYPYLDGLWPLWDNKRQALHDKAARTNVVQLEFR
jgi:uncharacterized RDD family membrane protein YckC